MLWLSLCALAPSASFGRDAEFIQPEIEVRGAISTINRATLAKLIRQAVARSKASCTSLGLATPSTCRLRWSLEPGASRPPIAILRVEVLDGPHMIKSAWLKMPSPGITPTAHFLHDICRMTLALEAQQVEDF